MKKVLKILLALFLCLIVVAGAYVSYVLISYHRLGDMALEVEGGGAGPLETNKEYTLLSWNIGFGAYEDDYGFFMDGGSQSWAWSKERLEKNLDAIARVITDRGDDMVLLQEVDTDATRTYHVNEVSSLFSAINPDEYGMVYCQNYDSPFLMYPLTQPHGASKSGIVTFSRWDISSARRVSLPVEESLMRLVDLDRCYSVSRLPVGKKGELVLYNLHLSAYTSDGTVATRQLEMLIDDMQAEYEKGNWCLAAGDFNKDLTGDYKAYFGTDGREHNWAQPIDKALFEGKDIVMVSPFDEEALIPSCRYADGPYREGQMVVVVDGFLTSPNVTALHGEVIDTHFRYSDHNPVSLSFTLKEEAP